MPVGAKGDGKIFPFKIIKTVIPFDAAEKKPLPMKLGSFFSTGDVVKSINAGTKALGQSWSGKWISKEFPPRGMFTQVSHATDPDGLSCNLCHTKEGIMDFKALGYTNEEVKKLEKSL